MRLTIGRTTYTRGGEVAKLGLANAIGYRVRSLLGEDFTDRCFVNVARLWRPMLKKPVFIGVAGSLGKTTAKELLVGLLSAKWQGIGNRGSFNIVHQIGKTILRVRRKHDFCVVELSEDAPGQMDEPLAMLRPSIGIVTVIGNDHWSAFDSREGIAKEVGKLVASLPATGTAVLNADDEHVLRMKATCPAKVITYGTSQGAELRAEDISSTWPNRLAMTLVWGKERVRLQTQLCASHLIPSVLGAIGVGLAWGMPLAECAQGIANIAPYDGRMQPVATSDGVTFIRDDFKASLGTIDACFQFMKAAQAKRKIFVIGTISDYDSSASVEYVRVAKRAQEIADITIFVGAWAPSVLKARKPGREHALRVFSHVRDAAEYINSITREGDLVLLKGSNKQDHLLRIILARTGDIACWREDCERYSFCNECADRNKPSGFPILMGNATISGATSQALPPDGNAIDSDGQVIIGLGNFESKYAGTPHNIGHEVVNRMAASLALVWETTPEAWIARGSSHGRGLCLIKIRTAMNLTGVGLKRLSESMGFAPDQCVLVFDDLDTPLGAVRTRMNGGAGGHRGVASILEAFQTDEFRRVKIGVGQSGVKLDPAKYVLTAFDAASRAAVDPAIPIGEAHVLELVKRRGTAKPQ